MSARGEWIPALVAAVVLGSSATPLAWAATGDEAQARIDRDIAAGSPVVVHVVVALCDNKNQGVVPVPRHLGNGQVPRSNLYWGARYGVRTFFGRQGGWTTLDARRPGDRRILERAIFFDQIQRANVRASVYVVADAWDGAEINAATERFLTFAAGGGVEAVSFRRDSEEGVLSAGGSAHVIAFIGHNGPMDSPLRGPSQPTEQASASSSIVLACASKPYFLAKLRAVGSHPLLLTTGLMAPEAYTLDATIRSWVGGDRAANVRDAAAAAYQEYQECGLEASRDLFWSE